MWNVQNTLVAGFPANIVLEWVSTLTKHLSVLPTLTAPHQEPASQSSQSTKSQRPIQAKAAPLKLHAKQANVILAYAKESPQVYCVPPPPNAIQVFAAITHANLYSLWTNEAAYQTMTVKVTPRAISENALIISHYLLGRN